MRRANPSADLEVLSLCAVRTFAPSDPTPQLEASLKGREREVDRLTKQLDAQGGAQLETAAKVGTPDSLGCSRRNSVDKV